VTVPSGNTDRRPRKHAPRRVPALIEQPERKPLFFGWGADLNHREKEAVKERLALFAGIGIAVALVLLFAWGAYQDYVAQPAAVRAASNKPIAQIGTYTLRTGFFKRFETFQQNQTNNQITQTQQTLAQVEAAKKSAQNSALIAQLQSQQQQLQQQLASLPSQALQTLITDQVVLQRSNSAGVKNDAKEQSAAWLNLMKQAGGKVHLQTFIAQSGLTAAELKQLVTADDLRTKLQSKLAAGVARVQPEVRASHILLPASKKAEAQKLLKQIQNGANFAQLAKKYSTDTGSAKSGGDLGYFAHGAMVAPFDKAAFSMKVGEVRLVKSQYGWHIIKVTGRERKHLSATEYTQAKTNAFDSWLNTQTAVLHIQRFVNPANLPAPVSTSTPLGGLTGQQSGQVPGGTTQGQTAPGSQVPATKSSPSGNTSSGSTGSKK